MLPNFTNVAELADRYYKLQGKEYSREQARKQFHQDKKRDIGMLKKIQREMNKQALREINNL